MAVTGIGISDDHLLKILGFRLIPVAAGGHLGSKIANTPPYLNFPKVGTAFEMLDSLEFMASVPNIRSPGIV